MKTYRCHKVVQAAKIVDMTYDGNYVYLEVNDRFRVQIPEHWMQSHEPQIGGYYVVYEDGYASYSPAEAFEKGYTEITGEERTPETLHYYAFQYRNAGSPTDVQKAYDDLVEFEKRCIAASHTR